jgi:DNA repair exonuclease SbcCD ATPase subunit
LPPSFAYTKIAKLKEERAALQQTREEYNIKKSRYDELQRTLTGENKSLEGRFSQMQKECEELESLYKLLMTTETSTLEQKAEEATQDEPSFCADSNLSQLYEDKICELQQLRTELSKEHQDYETKEGHDYILKQVAMFNSLKELLEMKQHCLLMGANTK